MVRHQPSTVEAAWDTQAVGSRAGQVVHVAEVTMQEKKRVLVIDDEEKFARLIALNLEATGQYEVRTDHTGEDAFVTLRQYEPDVILLDYGLPGLDGPQVCARLRKWNRTATVPVVMLSARYQMDEVDRALTSGVDDYLIKPVDLDVLEQKLREVIQLAEEGRLPCQLHAEIQAQEEAGQFFDDDAPGRLL